MTIDLSRRGRTRLVAAGATILSLFAAGCADDATTAPNPSHREPSATARTDDDPPTGAGQQQSGDQAGEAGAHDHVVVSEVAQLVGGDGRTVTPQGQ